MAPPKTRLLFFFLSCPGSWPEFHLQSETAPGTQPACSPEAAASLPPPQHPQVWEPTKAWWEQEGATHPQPATFPGKAPVAPGSHGMSGQGGGSPQVGGGGKACRAGEQRGTLRGWGRPGTLRGWWGWEDSDGGWRDPMHPASGLAPGGRGSFLHLGMPWVGSPPWPAPGPPSSGEVSVLGAAGGFFGGARFSLRPGQFLQSMI